MITFNQYPTSALYCAPAGSATLFFYDLGKTLAAQLSLSDTWTATVGYYLFTDAAPTVDAAFLAAVEQAFAGIAPAHTGFSWASWDSTTQKLGKLILLNTSADTNGNVSLAQDASIGFGRYRMPFFTGGFVLGAAGRQPCAPTDPAMDGFIIGYPPLDGLPKPDPSKDVHLPLLTDLSGCLLAQTLLSDLSEAPATGWNVGLRYFYPSPNQLAQGENVVSQRFPVLALPPGTLLLLHQSWHPLRPLDAARTYMAITGEGFRLVPAAKGANTIERVDLATGLPSTFRSLGGRQVNLSPCVQSADFPRFVFQQLPSAEGGEAAYYLVPHGEFELSLRSEAGADEVAVDNLLCGLAGTEYIRFRPRTQQAPGDRLLFVAGQPAYAPVFPVTQHSLADYGAAEAAAGALLTPAYTTAWAFVRPGPAATAEAPIYCSQPQGAALYNQADTARRGTPTDVSLLSVFDAPSARFDGAFDAAASCFPMVSYQLGLAPEAWDAATRRQFEEQILNPVRKQTLASLANIDLREPGASPAVTTTPQGLLTAVNDLVWETVLLAKNEEGDANLQFGAAGTPLPAPLKNALQNTQLFLVVSNPDPGKLGTFLNTVTLSGWPFKLNVGRRVQGSFSNVLLLKFRPGKITDLVNDTSAWTDAAIFNTDVAGVQTWLANYLTEAATLGQTNSYYDYFNQIVNNPAWTGILALKTDVGLSQFPEDLRGLLGGIDLSHFYAHHLGIEINYVEPLNGVLQMPKSSLFALISYLDKDYRPAASAYAHRNRHVPGIFSVFNRVEAAEADDETAYRYDFTVLTLEVLFQNSRIKDFTSKIQLTTNQWFGDSAHKEVSNDKGPFAPYNILLNGFYENHEGHNTYTFVTLKDDSYTFVLDSQVLHSVEFAKAQFNTLKAQAYDGNGLAASTTERISSVFTFWGWLNFYQLPGFDMFSFGSDNPTQAGNREGLYFSNLNVNMAFDLIQDGDSYRTEKRTFGFAPEQMAFDISLSKLRPRSLFRNFPLSVSGYLAGDEDRPVKDLGYLPVSAPAAFQAAPLGKKWQGLVFNLNLGSMGALAANAGFTAQLLAGWSPKSSRASAAALLKLPGVGGGKKQLGLQSVLNLSIGAFRFTAESDVLKPAQYTLTFSNIALKFLSLKFPPGGNTDLVLLGNPTAGAGAGSLGWYGAYAKAKPTG
ncbi:hypothetical protein MUN81_07370 [Hymenobacter sp. 5317J-9]|uniref:hypothetical protein n=1 Tax=Hymenobacter sp. 5317J-9 TaxID=2932250 RepID=UPI001FD67F0B|nr:hypothetical protein [Hymenobacter sp. 5317J-9]UOQ99311.1 hypothetical protein MUN81_07370 [Hymenobacter sp. 5317J-9]